MSTFDGLATTVGDEQRSEHTVTSGPQSGSGGERCPRCGADHGGQQAGQRSSLAASTSTGAVGGESANAVDVAVAATGMDREDLRLSLDAAILAVALAGLYFSVKS